MPNKVLLIGGLTIDHNHTESGRITTPGGASFFAAKTFENLGVSSTVISMYGKDFPKSILPSSEFYPTIPDCDKTVIFRNIIHKNGDREQWVENYLESSFKNISNIPSDVFNNKDILIVSSLLPDMTINQVKRWRIKSRARFSALSPQGFFRKIGKNGKILRNYWKDSLGYIKLFDAVVISEKDFQGLDREAEIWSLHGPVVLITREEKGASLYVQSQKHDFPAYRAGKIVNSIGAGDVFCAAFSYAFLKTKNLFKSAEFANATAAFSLHFPANKLKYKYQDILDFANRQRRGVEL